MPAAYTSVLSVQVLDFEDMCLLVQHARLICDFCSSGQRFACGFLQIPPHGGHPCRPANDSPCRVRRELSPPSGCALPGAHNRTARRKPAASPVVSLRHTPLPHSRGYVSSGVLKAKLRRTEETPWDEAKKVFRYDVSVGEAEKSYSFVGLSVRAWAPAFQERVCN